ncbi:uncharacterized protein LODBEIA_P31810 [Lodderomyces beijingensis]|uniref:Palmitoyltransferase n=1 Tax=Lodderomyces beijingensis TaxID=1775926 RepID=A0ABP0ZRS0_9ASCO
MWKLGLVSSEKWCCFLASLFPKVFCSLTLTWSQLVMLFIVPKYVDSKFQIYTQFIATNSLYLLCIYTYFKIIYVGPGSPLDYPQLKIRNLNAENPYNKHLPLSEAPPEFMTIHTRKFGGNQGFRFCTKCDCWKPDRTHHCSSSGKCILKMDHYCPWFAICIGFFNYKFFVQFLCYIATYCWIVFAITVAVLYNFLFSDKYSDQYLSINLVVQCVLASTFAFTVTIFASFSVYLMSRNLSTIEFQEQRWNYRGANNYNYEFDGNGKRKQLANIFDLGFKENLKQVLGTSWTSWLLPVDVNVRIADSGFRNGINFKVNEEVYRKWCSNAELNEQLNQQLREYSARSRRERESSREQTQIEDV